MTVESSTTSVELEGNGSAREFSFSPIKIFDETQLEVVLRDTDGSLTTLSLGTGSAAYSVQATFTENEASTGSVRYPDSGGTLLTAGQFLNIRRVVPFKQETNFENQGGYLPEVQEATHDLHTMRALQLQEELSRTVKVAFGSDVDAEDYLSTVAASAVTASAAAATATTKATEASASAAAAAASEAAAETAKDDAETAAASIGSSVSDAADSATAAASSATAAALSATAAATSATTATNSATTATTQATNASNSATTALSAQTAAEAARDATLAAYDNFDDRYLGAKASDPTLDNDGNALVAGALYFNTSDGAMKIYTGSAWVAAYVSGGGFLAIANNLSDLGSASTARTNLGLGTAALSDTGDFAAASHTHSASDIDSGTLGVTRGGTGLSSVSTGSLVVASATDVLAELPVGTNGQRLEVSGGVPAWVDASNVGIDYQTFTSSGTWTKPAGYAAGSRVLIEAWGGGGGGAGRSTGTAHTGGAGGAYKSRWCLLSDMGTTETITVGSGGAGGVGANGVSGGSSSVGSLLVAYGGTGGRQNATGTTPGGGHRATASVGTAANDRADNDGNNAALVSNTSGGAAANSVGGASVYGGGGGGGYAAYTGLNVSGGTSDFGGAGGTGLPTSPAGAGTAPGGGGGACNPVSGTGTGGAGASGQVRITVYPA